MKKIYCVMVLASLVFAGLVSCHTPKPNDPTNDGVTLAISGGEESIEVKGTDVEKDVVVTASKAAVAPIEVLLKLSDTEGNAVLTNNTLTIAEGQTSAKTTIKFPADKYPYGTDEKQISVTGETSSKGVVFETGKDKTTYFPYGEDGKITSTDLTITASSSTVNTAKQTSVTLTYTLTKKMAEDLTITQTTGTGEGVIDPSLVKWDKEAFVIKAGEKSMTATVTVEPKTEGKLPLTFAISSDKATLKTQSLEIIFEYKVNTDPVTLCLPEFEYNNYTITKTFSIGDYTLTPEHTVDGSGYGLIDMTAQVTAEVYEGDLASVLCQNKNSGRGDRYAAVIFIDWDRDGKLVESERLLYKEWIAGEGGQIDQTYSTNVTAPEGAASGKYYARLGNYFLGGSTFGKGGCGKVESGDMVDIAINYHAEEGALKASVAPEGSTALTASGILTKNFFVRLNKVATSDVTVNVAVTGGVATLGSPTVTVPSGQNSATGTISFDQANYPSGSGDKTVTLTISSSEIEIGTSKIDYIVSPLPASGVLDTYCKQVGNEGYSYASVGGVVIGSTTLPAANLEVYNDYLNLSQDSQYDVEISEGADVKILFRNQGVQGGCGMGDPFEAVVYADWNQDGDFSDNGEKYRKTFEVAVPIGEDQIQEVIITLNNIPPDAKTKSTLRILTHYLGTATIDGCQKVESGTVYDVAYNLSR